MKKVGLVGSGIHGPGRVRFFYVFCLISGIIDKIKDNHCLHVERRCVIRDTGPRLEVLFQAGFIYNFEYITSS